MKGKLKICKNKRGGGILNLFSGIVIVVSLALVLLTQVTARVTMDGIFSYTLANNPYMYLFIGGIYDAFPEEDGWIDAHILKENYAVETYDRFNYSSVYYHQRNDVHPPLYYMAVHTISSLFPGTYSNMYALAVNLLALFLADMLLYRLFKRLYGSGAYGLVPIMLLMSMETMRFLLTWARMYMLLFLFCVWYLSIHAGFLLRKIRKTDYVQMVLCIILGTLTHYYFYVFAAAVTLFTIIDLIRSMKVRELLRYLYFGIVGIAISWILYPWVLFHIFGNAQNKHTVIEGWSFAKVTEYAAFLREKLAGGGTWRWVLLLFVWCAWLFVWKRAEKGADEKQRRQLFFRRMTAGSGFLYSVIIYTLDGEVVYYHTALYAAFIVWASMVLLDLCSRVSISRLPRIPWERGIVRIGMALVGVWLICSGAVMGKYLFDAGEVIRCVWEDEPLEDDFWRAPEFFPDYDCLYIETAPDAIFHNYLFSFGEYRLFKKMSLEEFTLHGIKEEDLLFGKRGGDGLVVYLPKEYELDEREYRPFAESNAYRIYEYVGGTCE